MKKVLAIIALAALLVMPLILAGCGGTTLTESDIATIQGLKARVDSLEAQQASLSSTVANISPGTSEEDITQIKADLDSIRADLDGLKASDDTATLDLLTALIAKLETRIEALEGNGEEPPPSGEVTVTLNEDAPFEILSYTGGATPYRFTVTIENGTTDYQSVSYWVIFDCVTHGGATISDDCDSTISDDCDPTLFVSMVFYGGGGCDFDCTLVPNTGLTQQIFFTPCADFEIVAPKGKTVTIYHTIDGLETENTEVWEVTLAGVAVTKL